MAKILEKRVKKEVEPILNPFQSGFRKGRSTHYNTMIIYASWTLEKHMTQSNTQGCYLHYETMGSLNSTSSINIQGIQTEPFDMISGIKQGCPLSCLLFILYINPILDYIVNKYKGYGHKGMLIALLAFVDDIVLISESKDEIQAMLNDIVNLFNQYQLTLSIDMKNKSKTVYTSNTDDQIYITNTEGGKLIILELNTTEEIYKSEMMKAGRILNSLYQSCVTGYQTIEIFNKVVVPSVIYRTCIFPPLDQTFYTKLMHKFSTCF